MILDALNELKSLQSKGYNHIPKGNFSSVRYHPVLRFSRTEDNIYFSSWIVQALQRVEHIMSSEELIISQSIRNESRKSLTRYRSRYGQVSYNFYRADEWFPNGHFLSRFRTFQPTDDADDSCIAYRGHTHTRRQALSLKAMMLDQVNGAKRKFLKRGPEAYRSSPVYNTWLGSADLFVDLDLVVICNILMFNALYDLGNREVDNASVQFIIQVITRGEHKIRSWSLSAWYPFQSVILYSIADLLATGYYPELDVIKPIIFNELRNSKSKGSPVERLLRSSSLMKNKLPPLDHHEVQSIPEFLDINKDFTFGVIPVLHPFNGQLAQWLSSFPMLRLHYRCDAQMLAILIEYGLLKRIHGTPIKG